MAEVIHRTTLEYHLSASTPDDQAQTAFPDADWIVHRDTATGLLDAVSGIAKKYWKIVADTVVEMTQPEKDAVDLTGLPGLKTSRKAEIDKRTEELIEVGFEYPAASGKIFSLSESSQRYMDKVQGASGGIGFSYPVHWVTKDDADSHDSANAGDAMMFFSTAFVAVRTHTDSGAALKETIQATTTVAACLAVVDPR